MTQSDSKSDHYHWLGLGFLAAVILCLLAAPATAQTREYIITPLGQIPDAYNTIPTGLNDAGDVVGWAQFIPGTPPLVA